jgi:hypothetical protein
MRASASSARSRAASTRTESARTRPRVYGRTKTEVRDQLKKLKEKLDADQDNGPEGSSSEVTLRECAETWLAGA